MNLPITRSLTWLLVIYKVTSLGFSLDFDEENTLDTFEKRSVDVNPKDREDNMKILETKLGEEIREKLREIEEKDFGEDDGRIRSGFSELSAEERSNSLKNLATIIGEKIGAELGPKIRELAKEFENEKDEFPNRQKKTSLKKRAFALFGIVVAAAAQIASAYIVSSKN